jgi:hypothetical protein
VNEDLTERNRFKKQFSNTTSRILMGAWLLVKGSGFSLKLISELLSLPEDAMEAKLQTFAGMGLVHVTTDSNGERQVEFLPPASPELEKIIWELFEGRKHDFDSVEQKMRSLIYKTLLKNPMRSA